MTTIVLAGERLDLRRESARALADHLWQGRRPGAVTAAANLATAIDTGHGCVEFAPHEVDAVRDGLEALGIG